MKPLTKFPSLVVLLIGVAALVAATARTEETADPEGKKLFVQYRCNSCHTIRAAAIAKKKVEGEESTGDRKPPDLSGVGIKRTAEWIGKFVAKKEMVDGHRHPKKFRGTLAEVNTIAAWLSTMKTEVKK